MSAAKSRGSAGPAVTEWTAVSSRVEGPAPHVLHVWRARTDAWWRVREADAGVLNDEELARAAAFVQPVDRDRFVAMHGILRRVLGDYLGMPPGEIEFRTGALGKPHLAGSAEQSGLQFNASRSGDWCAFAIAAGGRVGVDVERNALTDDYLTVADAFFSPAEVAILTALPRAEHERAFFDCWTRKEAMIKAVGAGLYLDLKAFDVPLDPLSRFELDLTSEADGIGGLWTVACGDLAPGYSGAAAMQGPMAECLRFEWAP
ncbi:MAG: 4'-phosphopantetheinyl transferase superfamily protein [Armatimonadetes bacterium]|nr:4'-phosphopantetheinyl transferase superfamily protein [Armatimonadota bacterium]MDE2207054.1 4'-phosphopantetheinyl transferase superfamily protein [Armatimonadota bacterium]